MFTTRALLVVLAALVLWYGGLVVWSSQPLTEAIPTVFVDGGDDADPREPGNRSQRVQCASALSGSPYRHGRIPQADPGYTFIREPCVGHHQSTRRMLFVNSGLFVILAGGAIGVSRRQR